jgi:hypothetical protein
MKAATLINPFRAATKKSYVELPQHLNFRRKVGLLKRKTKSRTGKPVAGSEGDLERFGFANELSSGMTAFKMDAPHLFLQCLSSSCTIDTPVSEIFHRMLCTANVCIQKIML